MIDFAHLKTMTVKELEELKGRIDGAIRDRIRARNASMAAPSVKRDAPSFDLASERDAWLKSRR